ncbi:hypothetical protein, partial [Paenibacillus sp. UNC496MF]|uniref:hypothetical protein n=1 Tax=Paenibacillus sp. UNC496MF TaxID=1502753 RepID=UPI001C436693
ANQSAFAAECRMPNLRLYTQSNPLFWKVLEGWRRIALLACAFAAPRRERSRTHPTLLKEELA